MKETLGEYVHRLRIEKGLTLTKLAAALDLDQSTLSKIENNKRSFTVDTIIKIASFFELDVKTLELEYYSEKIADIIYKGEDTTMLLNLAQEKSNYWKIKYATQGKLNLVNEHFGDN